MKKTAWVESLASSVSRVSETEGGVVSAPTKYRPAALICPPLALPRYRIWDPWRMYRLRLSEPDSCNHGKEPEVGGCGWRFNTKRMFWNPTALALSGGQIDMLADTLSAF